MYRLHVILFWIAVAVILIIGFIDGNFLGGESFILINWAFLALVAGNLSYFDKSEKYRLPLIGVSPHRVCGTNLEQKCFNRRYHIDSRKISVTLIILFRQGL